MMFVAIQIYVCTHTYIHTDICLYVCDIYITRTYTHILILSSQQTRIIVAHFAEEEVI